MAKPDSTEDQTNRPDTLAAIRSAFAFMSVFPVGSQHQFEPRVLAAAIKWYPLVGLVIGACLFVFASISPFSVALTSALLLLLAVGLTGALHLDGVADCADAWVGGLGSREKTLQIMKDPHSGPMAVVVITLLLLVKYAALLEIVRFGFLELLVIAPLLGRLCVMGLMATTQYVGSGMIGASINLAPTSQLMVSSFFALVAVLVVLPEWQVVALIVAAIIVTSLLRNLMIQRIGGFTGDCAGCVIEFCEVMIFLLGILVL